MEGCASFHYWARVAQSFGHEVRGMAPKKVKPYIGNQKTDANDAIAIASTQLGMTFCQVKNLSQQNIQAIQISRKWFDRTTTSLGYHMRALCFEYGATTALGKKLLRQAITHFIPPESKDVPEPNPTIAHDFMATISNNRRTLQSGNATVKALIAVNSASYDLRSHEHKQVVNWITECTILSN